LGIANPLNLLFFFSMVVAGCIIFLLSFENSILQMKVVNLASNLGLLEQRVGAIEAQKIRNER
jgi:hypothetical protein